jgi:deazaflavin-dependent oxidoreductase (nitroreductase family)
MTFRQQILKGWRIILKHTLNPLTRRLARSSFGPFSLIRHVGRRSGKQYETPIIVAPIEDGFVIELTYGPDVDWYKNVLAAGGCTLLWHGKNYVIDRIEPISTEAGRSVFPIPAQVIFQLMNLQHFVKILGARA